MLSTLIDREKSDYIKGFLMFFIILGHNMIFTSFSEDIGGMGYLYCFHIQSFFILPFLYGRKELNKKRILNYFLRLYFPFILLVIIFYFIYRIIYLGENITFDLFKTIFYGDSVLLKENCGLQIFWFMPAMFSLSLIKDLFSNAKKWVIYLFCFISLISNIYLIFFPFKVFMLPFGLHYAICYLVLGYICRFIYSFILRNNFFRFTILICFIICSVFYFVNFHLLDDNIHLFYLLKFITPMFFFPILVYYIRYFYNIKLLYLMGKYSFSIYLIHPFIGYILYYLLLYYSLEISLLHVVLSQFILIVLSYYISVLIYRNNKLRILLFPRSIEELKSLIEK